MKYKKLSLKITAFVSALVIGFTSPVGAVCTLQAQAASVTAPLEMQLWQLVFSVLGLSFTFDSSVSNADANIAYFEEWYNELSAEEQAKFEGFGGTFTEFIENDILTIPENIWDGLKSFANSIVGELTPIYKPIDNLNISSYSNAQFSEFVLNQFQPISTAISVSNSYLSQYSSFISKLYSVVYSSGCFCISSKFDSDSSNYIYIVNGFPASGYMYWSSFGRLYGANSQFQFVCNPDTGYMLYELDYSKNYWITSDDDNVLFFVNYLQYDFFDCLPYTLGFQSGNLYFSDFVLPSSNVISSDTFMAFPTIKNGVSVSDLYESSAYDVVTPGRTFDKEKQKVSGNVVINIPSYDVLEGYNNGIVTWEELMEEANVRPVDTASDSTLTGADSTISDALAGIEASSNGIAGFVEGIWNTLTGLSDALLSGIVGLFVPAEGFIDTQLARMMDGFDGMGVSPYDMSSIFSNNGNPFKNIIINIRGTDIVIVSFDYLPPFIEKFRPVIRGLMALFMIYYCINQLLGLLRISGLIQGDNGTAAKGSGGTDK